LIVLRRSIAHRKESPIVPCLYGKSWPAPKLWSTAFSRVLELIAVPANSVQTSRHDKFLSWDRLKDAIYPQNRSVDVKPTIRELRLVNAASSQYRRAERSHLGCKTSAGYGGDHGQTSGTDSRRAPGLARVAWRHSRQAPAQLRNTITRLESLVPVRH